MSLKSTTLFVALILSAATPALADRIPMDLQKGETVSHNSQQWIHGKTSAIRFDSEDTKIAEVDVLKDSRLSSSNRQVALFAIGSNEGHAFERDNDNSWRKHKDKGRDGGDVPISSVAVPEPGSQLSLLFGLAGLGILFFRRNSLKQAI